MNEMNPDFTDNPDDNFSIVESVRGYIAPRPLNARSPDIRLYMDQLGRPDLYAIRCLNRQRNAWNNDIAKHSTMLYVFHHDVKEVYPATKKLPERIVEATYDYLRVLRGVDFVRQLDEHIHDTISGLEARATTIRDAVNIRAVDSAIDSVLQENREIQNGSRRY